jgi:AcrR family transcriptional regulator
VIHDRANLDVVAVGAASVAETSLRERKKNATRKAIEDAAWELFAERGYAATSVDDIAARADVAPRTFFRYFRTKEDVLYGEYDEAMEAFAVAFRARPRDEPIFTSLERAMEETSREHQKDRSRMVERHELQREAGLAETGESIKQRFISHIADLVREREADNPDGELLARLVAGTIVTCQSVANEYWLETGATDDLHDVGKHCMRLLFATIGASGDPVRRR